MTATGAPRWFVESVTIGGQDALDAPFEIKPDQNISDAHTTFTDRQTDLSGTLVDERHQPALDYTLLVFPADSQFWTASTRRIRTVRPATDGRYTIRNLPPATTGSPP